MTHTKKIFISILLTTFLFFSNTCHPSIFDKITSVPKCFSQWTIRKVFDKTFNSNALQGAAAGTGIALLADLLIKVMEENNDQDDSDRPAPATSILSIVLCSLWGTFVLDNQNLGSTAKYAIEISLVLAALNFSLDLTADYASAYEEEKPELFRENLVNAGKQTLLNFISCMSGKYAKIQIEGLKAP